MPATAAARLKEIRDFALSLPGTQPKSPWPGHDDVAVNDKTFLYLGLHDGEVSVGVKLPVTRAAVLALPKATPMGYGLGKSGWVSISFEPLVGPPLGRRSSGAPACSAQHRCSTAAQAKRCEKTAP